jgi:hypothetical protein
MSFNASIYANQTHSSFDPVRAIEKGMSMADAIAKKKLRDKALAEEASFKDLVSKNMKVDENGNMKLDYNSTLAGAAKINPKYAMQVNDWRNQERIINDRETERKRVAQRDQDDYNYRQNRLALEEDKLNHSKALLGQKEKQRLASIEQKKREKENLRAQKLADQKEQRAYDEKIRNEEREYRSKEKFDKTNEEFGTRFGNIVGEIEKLDQKIKKYGTYEMFGPHNEELEQLITSISTDTAKLVDPSSVARPSEVEGYKKMFFEPGTLTMRNKTARGTIKHFREIMIEKALRKAQGMNDPKLMARLYELSGKDPRFQVKENIPKGLAGKPSIINQNRIKKKIQNLSREEKLKRIQELERKEKATGESK